MRTIRKWEVQSVPLITVDWGTSSFRLSHINSDREILSSVHTDTGITKVPKKEMENFLVDQISKLGHDCLSLPVIMCGMVGSAIGWQEIPYLSCPITPKDLAVSMTKLDCHRINAYIVPGLSTTSSLNLIDMMRGEETQIVGWILTASEHEKEESLLCLPGTHTKWVSIKNSDISHFNTALTGELFAILSGHSILLSGAQQESPEAFDAGVKVSQSCGSLLHLLFSTRSQMLSGELCANHCKSYLSGLIIGCDVRAAIDSWPRAKKVHVIGADALNVHYERAFCLYGIDTQLHDGNAASINGLWSVYHDNIMD